VPLPDLSATLGAGWSLGTKGTLGELVLAILAGAERLNLQGLELANPSSWTNEAATGWGGDVFHHYVKGGEGVTVLATVWDTAKDAQEFEAALRPMQGRKSFRRDVALVLVGGATADQAATLGAKALDALTSARASAR
jgi:hypothetical protein